MQSALVGIPQPACGEYHVGNTLWGMTLRVDSNVAAFLRCCSVAPGAWPMLATDRFKCSRPPSAMCTPSVLYVG